MLLDVRKPQEKWFELPTPREIAQTYEIRESHAQNIVDVMQELFLLLIETDKALYLPWETILPEELLVGMRSVELRNARDFKKLARFTSIGYGRSNDPQQRALQSLRRVSIIHPHFGYGWISKLPGTEKEQLKIIPLVSCVDGLELYTVYIGRANEVAERTGRPIQAPVPRVYLDTFEFRVPSRTQEEVKFYRTKLISLPTQASGNDWTAIDFQHTCPDSIFKFRKGREIRYFCDHVRATYRYAQVFKENTDDPITFDPFLIPSKLFVDFHDILRYRFFLGKRDRRNVNEAEREYLSLAFVPFYLSDRRHVITDLFKTNYTDVEDYLVKIV